MDAKHTPGPWVHYPDDNLITTADGRGLIEWQARSVNVSVAERDANARLIAAAPELLEAAIKARAELKYLRDRLRDVPTAHLFMFVETVTGLEAAIAKALGEPA